MEKKAFVSRRHHRMTAAIVASALAASLVAAPAEAVDGCTAPGFPEWADRGLDAIFVGACQRHDECYSQCNPMFGPYKGLGHKEGCDLAFSLDMAAACVFWAPILSLPIGPIEDTAAFLRYCTETLVPASFALMHLPAAFSAWYNDQHDIGCNANLWGVSPYTMVSMCLPCTSSCWGQYCGYSTECYSDGDCSHYCTGYEAYCGYVCSGGTCINFSPIVVDVAGDGYKLTDVKDGVIFNLNGRGPAKISWTSPRKGNAWLALDRSGNGLIDDGSELFGSYTPQPRDPDGHANGFRALAIYDLAENGGNDNGRIDRRDRIYDRLRLWIDGNQNGISEAAELRTLKEYDIVAIDLDYRLSDRVDRHGNQFRYRGDIIERDGGRHRRTIWDVVLRRDP